MKKVFLFLLFFVWIPTSLYSLYCWKMTDSCSMPGVGLKQQSSACCVAEPHQ
ncbi:hypothetical protein C4K22_3211 [Pseudomonas chlororaphis subsp. aurantiaca]|nr:hypothetical protein C4K22_3211 [Pseudomonas chlororaphis subsp. aurantiaca]AZD42291.1 hypothetical protein C4K21_3217 [Pseudomonas chlororaphis subsp. aurantiaca]AZD66982.1 hypothetical protein C4K17_3096 [Pseudomonas chlororaphis subsp. aurantiaca]AZD79677.1 hypothetical protein C4K15_3110 [Pseudomonas chlororaphis subsp. aurantiaca]